jgi:hypothetical protein
MRPLSLGEETTPNQEDPKVPRQGVGGRRPESVWLTVCSQAYHLKAQSQSGGSLTELKNKRYSVVGVDPSTSTLQANFSESNSWKDGEKSRVVGGCGGASWGVGSGCSTARPRELRVQPALVLTPVSPCPRLMELEEPLISPLHHSTTHANDHATHPTPL